MSVSGKVVWITGASSGIGEALAYEYASLGAKLILSARRLNELERVKDNIGKALDTVVHIITLDLTDEATLDRAVEQAYQLEPHIDILINNGGISTRALTHETSIEVDRRVMEVDYFGHIMLTKRVLPKMRERKSGHFVVISSVAGKFGFHQRSAYSAAKHALHGYYEALSLEQAENDIYVTMVCPGRVKTNISFHALTSDGSPHGKMDQGQEEGMPVEKCAKKIVSAVRRKKREVYIGGKEVVLVYLKRYLPWLFFRVALGAKPT